MRQTTLWIYRLQVFLTNLCAILEVTVNELLSGERLDDVDYKEKAENNITTIYEDFPKTDFFGTVM